MFTAKNIVTILGWNILFSFLAVFLASVGIAFFSQKIEQLSDATVLNRRLDNELKKMIDAGETLKNDARIIGGNDILIDNAFVPSDNVLGFADTLDDLARKQSLLQMYYFSTPAPSILSSTYLVSTVPYSNTITSNVSNFSKYLKEFNILPYFTTIEGFTISSQDQLGWQGSSTIVVKALLYTKTAQ